MSSYRSARGADASDATVGPALEGPCQWCRAIVLVETLNTFGARCKPCYDAYLREPQPATNFMADKRLGDPKEWAQSLRRREQSGERLTLAQRAMWRTALGVAA